MDKAFDTILNTEVDATTIAKSSTATCAEWFRYQCLCCGEEVFLAAVDSTQKSPHFRHRNGNNETECELYLGQPGAIERFVADRKNKACHLEFGFNLDKLAFEIGVAMSEAELNDFNKIDRRLLVHANLYNDPIITVPINREVFVPNQRQYFTLTKIAYNYRVSFNSGIDRILYSDVFKADGKLNIYRRKQKSEHCKLQSSGTIYTDTGYVAISEVKENVMILTGFTDSISTSNVFSFTTDGVEFYGVKFTVNEISDSTLRFFFINGFSIESSESVCILWPPVAEKESTYICATQKLFLKPSFELIPHGNINIGYESFRVLDQGIVEIDLENKVIIHEKNVDITIQNETVLSRGDCLLEKADLIYVDKFLVPNDFVYFLFSCDGCTHLAAGTLVYLTKTDRIVGYRNGHIRREIYKSIDKEKNPREMISDILMYYPLSERFEPDDYMKYDTTEAVTEYLESCYRSGEINTVIRQYIREGKL